MRRRGFAWLSHNRRLQIGLAMFTPFGIAALLPGQLAPYPPDELLSSFPSPSPSAATCSGPTRTGATSSAG